MQRCIYIAVDKVSVHTLALSTFISQRPGRILHTDLGLYGRGGMYILVMLLQSCAYLSSGLYVLPFEYTLPVPRPRGQWLLPDTDEVFGRGATFVVLPA